MNETLFTPVKVINKKSRFNKRSLYFHQIKGDRYVIQLEGSTQSMRIRRVLPGERKVTGTNLAMFRVPKRAKWLAMSCTHWRGPVDVLGVVSFGQTPEEVFKSAFPVVWPA